MRVLWQNEIIICQYLNTVRNKNISSLFTLTGVARKSPSSRNIRRKWPARFEKRRLRQISACNVSTVRDSEKVQLWRIESRPRTFRRAIDGLRMLPLSPLNGWSKSDLFVLPRGHLCEGGLSNRNSVCPFVCLSGTRVDCDKIKWCTADILIPHESAITVLLWHQQWSVCDLRSKWPTPSKNADFDRFLLITSQP